MEHPNATLARQFLAALDAGDVATLESIVAEDVVAHLSGSHALSGTHQGRGQLFEVFAKVDQLVGGTLERQLHDITASDDHIVILVTLSAQRDGVALTWKGANIWNVRDGMFSEVWLLSADQAVTDQALA